MIASTSWLQSALNFLMNRILVRWSSSQIFDLFHSFRGFITSPDIVLRPAFWSQYMAMCLVFQAFIFSPVILLATTKASAFFYIVCTFPPNLLISLAKSRSWLAPLNFKPSWFTWTLLMAYSKSKLKIYGDKASPCCKPFLIGNMSDKFLPTWALIYVSFRHIYKNSIASFMGIPNSMGILYKTSLLTEW